MDQKLQEVCGVFRIGGTYLGYETIRMGNINQTYKVNFRTAEGEDTACLVQNVNTYAFRNPVGLMGNIDQVTEHIRRKSEGGTCLQFYRTAEDRSYWIDGSNFWRVMNFIPSTTYNSVKDLRIIGNAARAFGDFQNRLADFDSRRLIETIPDFHNTVKRYEMLEQAISEDAAGRAAQTAEEIAYLRSIRELACSLTEMGRRGELPVRVTHNDTKINNVLFDSRTGDALTVIDLDTVMPGLIGHDFGDAIRFAANFVEEDCPDDKGAGIDLDIFRAFTEGFLEQTLGTMTSNEIGTLALSCVVMTAELAVRFLDDYLRGDPYFKILYPEHNLVRTRCQIALCRDMVKHLDEMNRIVASCVK